MTPSKVPLTLLNALLNGLLNYYSPSRTLSLNMSLWYFSQAWRSKYKIQKVFWTNCDPELAIATYRHLLPPIATYHHLSPPIATYRHLSPPIAFKRKPFLFTNWYFLALGLMILFCWKLKSSSLKIEPKTGDGLFKEKWPLEIQS